MKAGGVPAPRLHQFFISRIRCRTGQAAACKAVALRERWGFESLLMHVWKVGHGHAEQSRKLSERKLLWVRLPHLPPKHFGGAAQKAVQRRAKPPGAGAPLCVRVAPPPL